MGRSGTCCVPRPFLCGLALDSKVPPADCTKHGTNFTTAFYHDYKFYWIFMKIFGLFPYYIDRKGDLQFNWISKEMLYAVVVYTITSIPVAITVSIRFEQRLLYAGNFDIEMCLYMFTFLLAPHIIIPVSHWFQMRGVVAIFKKWHLFECNYESVMKHKLSLTWGWSAHLYLTPGMVLITASIVLSRFVGKSSNVWIELVAHLYVLTIVLIHLIILVGVGYRLIHVARQIRLKLMEAIQSHNVGLVVELAGLWTRYGEVCNALGCLFHRMYSCILVMIFALSTIVWYSLIKAYSNNNFRLDLLYQISCLVNNNLWLYFMCECGHRITVDSGPKFIRLIATMRATVKDPAMKSELDSLISQISSFPIALTLNGYVALNRPLLVSLKGTMSTYLIVVLQFSQDYSSTLDIKSLKNNTDMLEYVN